VKFLPYRARTATGDSYDIEFPLHGDTVDPVRVSQLVSTVLGAIDRDIGIALDTSNGDVLQAVAMALAIRARMIQAPHATVSQLASDLLSSALDAVANARHEAPRAGHA